MFEVILLRFSKPRPSSNTGRPSMTRKIHRKNVILYVITHVPIEIPRIIPCITDVPWKYLRDGEELAPHIEIDYICNVIGFF